MTTHPSFTTFSEEDIQSTKPEMKIGLLGRSRRRDFRT
jgi:hypothetical protein